MTQTYPKKYEKYWKLPNHNEVCFRPIKPEDEPLWQKMFEQFSEESVRNRFFRLIKNPPYELSFRYCNIDYNSELAIVAEIIEDNKRRILGVVRLIIHSDMKTAEIAFIIADPWQRLGLGSKMIDYMLKICKEKKLENVYASVLPDNFKAISFLNKKGCKIECSDDYATRIKVI